MGWSTGDNKTTPLEDSTWMMTSPRIIQMCLLLVVLPSLCPLDFLQDLKTICSLGKVAYNWQWMTGHQVRVQWLSLPHSILWWIVNSPQAGPWLTPVSRHSWFEEDDTWFIQGTIRGLWIPASVSPQGSEEGLQQLQDLKDLRVKWTLHYVLFCISFFVLLYYKISSLCIHTNIGNSLRQLYGYRTCIFQGHKNRLRIKQAGMFHPHLEGLESEPYERLLSWPNVLPNRR